MYISFTAIATGYQKEDTKNTIYITGTEGFHFNYNTNTINVGSPNMKVTDGFFGVANAFIQNGTNIQGKKIEALQCFDKILEKFPEEIPAIYGKGMVYFEFGEIEQAIGQFDIVLEMDPNEIDSLYAKGAILSNLGKNQEALTLLEKTIELDPKLHIAWLAKGYIFLNEEKYDEAIISF